jgi:hypothetical protein
MSARDIVSAIAVTAELTQTQLSAVAMKSMADDLMAEYLESAILAALTRCRRELPGRLSQSAVIERIDQADGRPTANEAWGIALAAFDEAATVVTNDEIGDAMAAARPVMDGGDEVGARMAFRDAYDRIVRKSRLEGVRAKWYPSLGHDPLLRVDAIKRAEERGLLTKSQASAYLPAPMTDDDRARGGVIAGLLTGDVAQMPNDPEFKRRVGDLMAVLKGRQAA